MIVIGVDVGLRSGAWSALDHNGRFVGCGDIPTLGDRIDSKGLRDIFLAQVPPGDTAHIVIEDVWVMPKQGLVSSAGFMRAAGAIEAVASLLFPVTMVRPQVWKKHNSLIGESKAAGLALARVMWPEAPLKLVKHHGRGDSLLIAKWGLDTLS